jgi:hypothetical protein
MPHLKYNVDASKLLFAHVSEVFRLRRQTSDLSVGTQEAIIQSRALLAKVDDVLAMHAMREGWLWPAY